MYTNFATIYDRLMNDIPYEKWVKYIQDILAQYNLKPEMVLDLGCGTGNVAIPMARLGYQVTALDLSTDMLAVAEQKSRTDGLNIKFIHQDMRQIDLPANYDLVVSMCDSLNYLLEDADLKNVFTKIYELLNPGGLFVFDLNTAYKIGQIFANETFVYNEDDVAYIWENSFEPATSICDMDLTFFVRDETNHYKRFMESHAEKGYDSKEVVKWLADVGFNHISIYEAITFKPPEANTERIYFIVKK